jgi:hypothetical protein
MLYGITVCTRSRGRIRAIHFGDDIPWDEFTIVRAKDIPGKHYMALIDTRRAGWRHFLP